MMIEMTNTKESLQVVAPAKLPKRTMTTLRSTGVINVINRIEALTQRCFEEATLTKIKIQTLSDLLPTEARE